MSAFYDIWISNKKGKPEYCRLDNDEWIAHKDIPDTFISLPGNDKYVHEYNNGDAAIIVIGNFYHSIGLPELLNDCLGYIDNAGSFDEPAGHYIIFIYRKYDKTYHVFTNRLGTYHAYWLSINGTNAISTYYTGLAKSAITKTLDWEGITGFMAMGFFPGNTTYLEGISILEPASHYVFNEQLDMLKHQRYWNWQHNPVEQQDKQLFKNFDSILSDILTTATEEQRVALPVSGGLDSRTIAGVLGSHRNNALSVWSYSYGFDKESKEIKIASKIASAHKFDFNGYAVPRYLFDKADAIADSVELFQYIDGTRQACMLDELMHRADVVIGGHWGDVWMDDMGMDNMDEDTFFQKKVVKKGSGWLLKEVCKPHYPSYENFLKNYFNNWTYNYRHIKDVDFRMKIFKTDQWSFRWTLPSIRMYQAAVMPVLPFYDKRIVDFFTEIPTSAIKNRTFQVEYLKAYHPKLADIKWQEYDSNLYNYKTYNNRNIGYRVFNKAKAILSAKKPIVRNWELFYLNEEGRIGLEDILLNNKPFLNIVSEDKVKELLHDLYEYPNAANGYKVSMMHTLARFMKIVFGG